MFPPGIIQQNKPKLDKYYDIKIKSPFLDNDVIKFGLSLPLKQKFNNKNQKGKIVLRKISKRLSRMP